MAVFDHLCRRQFGYVGPDVSLGNGCGFRNRVDHALKQLTLALCGTTGANMSVHKNLLRAKRTSTHEVIALRHFVENHLSEERLRAGGLRSEEHTSELQSHHDLVCR